MGMVLPVMLSYHNYREYELEHRVKTKNKELRENAENAKKKYGCKYIWETRCQSFVRNCRIRLENMNEEKQ